MSDFYIGWGEGTPNSKKTTSRFFLLFLILMIVLVSLFVTVETPFAASTFDYGNQTEIKGELVRYPVLAVRVRSTDGAELIPLVGYGKMGPQYSLQSLPKEGSIQVSLRGTLIEHKGRKLLELTDGEQAVIAHSQSTGSSQEVMTGIKEIKGEIIDPKCFFGVMKPGYGKVHKSCAIRCISGQIPPVLAMREGEEFVDFYFVSDVNGALFTGELLQYVGMQVQIKGETSSIDNWKIIKVDLLQENLEYRTLIDKGIQVCASL